MLRSYSNFSLYLRARHPNRFPLTISPFTMRKIFLFLCFCLGMSGTLSLFSQQIPLFFTHRNNANIVNPAMTGVPMVYENEKRVLEQINWIGGLSTRIQWTQFGENSPLTSTFRLMGKAGLGNNRRRARADKFMWLGGYVMTDRTGPTSVVLLGGNASYHVEVGRDAYFQVGLSIRMAQHKLDPNKLVNYETGDPVIDRNSQQTSSFVSPGWGVFYSNPYFYAGASMPQTVLQTPDTDQLQLSNHFYGVLGAYLPLPANDYTFLEPAVWVKSAQNFPLLVDVHLRLRSALTPGNEEYPMWVGFGYDTGKAAKVELGLSFEALQFNFVYSHYLSLGSSTGSAVEGGLSFMFN